MKRALLITYYFPPSGGPGVQRMLKFAKYLPEWGWQPTVLTVDPEYAAYPSLDLSMTGEIPPSTRVVRTRAWDPFALYARLQGLSKEDVVGVGFVKEGAEHRLQVLARWIRGNVFLPDARVGWIPFARRAAKRLLREHNFEVVMTSGPPHSTHLVGKSIQRRFGAPWVVDMRDPWSDYYYHAQMRQTGIARRINIVLERGVLARADAVVSVSKHVGAGLREKATIRRYETIPNGFDAADIAGPCSVREDRHRFVIAHVGTYTKERHAPGLLQALKRLCAKSDIEIQFVGHLHAEVEDAYQAAGLSDALRVVSYVPHHEAIKYMQSADILLVALERVAHSRGIVTGKVFEYLSLGVPVLGVGGTDGDLAAVLRATQGGQVFEHDDEIGMETFISKHIARVQRREASPAVDATLLRPYDRRELTRRMATLFDDIQPSA